MTKQDEINKYLDELRERGVCNMWGAGAYVQKVFGVSERDANDSLGVWMDSFEERHPQV